MTALFRTNAFFKVHITHDFKQAMLAFSPCYLEEKQPNDKPRDLCAPKTPHKTYAGVSIQLDQIHF